MDNGSRDFKIEKEKRGKNEKQKKRQKEKRTSRKTHFLMCSTEYKSVVYDVNDHHQENVGGW